MWIEWQVHVEFGKSISTHTYLGNTSVHTFGEQSTRIEIYHRHPWWHNMHKAMNQVWHDYWYLHTQGSLPILWCATSKMFFSLCRTKNYRLHCMNGSNLICSIYIINTVFFIYYEGKGWRVCRWCFMFSLRKEVGSAILFLWKRGVSTILL